MKRYRLVVSPEAQADLMEIRLWLRDAAGSDVARRLLQQVRERIASLTEAPERGALRPEFGPAVRLSAIGAYLILL